MERLTEYDEFGNAEFVGIDNTKLYERLVCDETVALTIATNKLAEFEDFMEANKFENIQDLQNALNSEFVHIFDEKHKIWIKTIEDTTYVEKRNRMLEERWQKLREWVERKYADDYIDANDTKSPLTAQEYYGGSADSCRKTLDKMQELEIKE